MNKFLVKILKCDFQIIVSIFLMTLLSYLFVLNNGPIGDDQTRIIINYELDSLFQSLTGRLGDRPILMLSLWLDNKIFGLDLVWLRIVSIFYHSLVSWQIYCTIQDFSIKKGNWNQGLALIIALLFALHPLNNQAINIVIQRGVILSALFGILSVRYFYKYIQDLANRYLATSVLCLFFAILSKPNAFFLPIFYACVVFYLPEAKRMKKMVFGTILS